MLNENHSAALRSQLSDNAEKLYNEERNMLIQKQEYALISSLGLKPYKDGNQWFFLFGNDLQSGVCGFGDTPYLAMLDFNKKFGG